MKEIYIFAWVIWSMIAIGSLLANTYNAAALISLSMAALVLVYILALWAVFRNTKESTAIDRDCDPRFTDEQHNESSEDLRFRLALYL